MPLDNLPSSLTCPSPLAHLQGKSQNPQPLHNAQLRIHPPRHVLVLLPSLMPVEEAYAFHSTLRHARAKDNTPYRLTMKKMQMTGSTMVNMVRLQT